MDDFVLNLPFIEEDEEELRYGYLHPEAGDVRSPTCSEPYKPLTKNGRSNDDCIRQTK